jgi:hypothetical protein
VKSKVEGRRVKAAARDLLSACTFQPSDLPAFCLFALRPSSLPALLAGSLTAFEYYDIVTK